MIIDDRFCPLTQPESDGKIGSMLEMRVRNSLRPYCC